MASKYERITDLYLQTAGEVATPEAWPRFLTTACYNFRLSFDKQILLYAQRPDATAVLPIEGRQGWNQRFGRWVNRGSKGIAILDSDSNGQARIKYYFDIADTHEGRYPRPVPIWTVHPEQEQAIMETLENSFGVLGNTNTLGDALLSAASNVMEDNFQDYLAQLIYYKEGSFLEPLDDESLEAIFKPMLQNSICYMLLVRCGVDPGAYFQREDFSYISGFNTLQTINALGTATSDISQMCLSEIARTVLSLQRQENRTFEEPAENEYAVVENQPERSMNHDTDHIHEAGGLSASQPSPSPGTSDSPWEVRIDAPQISPAEPESDLHESSDHGAAPRTSDGDRGDSQAENLADGSADGTDRGRDGGTESHRPDEMGGADEQFPSSSGGADSAGIDLRIDGIIPPPSFEEQISFLGGGYLAPEQEDEQQTFFSQPQLPQQVIDEALCIGFNDRNSRLIICAYFIKDKPLEDNAVFLQKCYGTNGAGLFIQDREYAIWYDADGIRFSGMNPEITLRKHQINAIAHIMYGGNTLLAHEVGAGKTFEMVAAAMESKRLGLCQKSIFVVPNHLTEQWASEFLRLYPSANILVTKQRDFETKNRKKFCARIATGDYDAVIIGHSQFEKIPISKQRQERLLQDQIAEITMGISELKESGGEKFSVKELERTKRGLESRLEKLRADDKKDDVVTFEELGVDRMFVDEAHNYKNCAKRCA